MQRMIGEVLALVAGMFNKVAAVTAPAREVDAFPHRLWAQGRRWLHFAAHRSGPGDLSIEVGGWTVDVSWTPR